jgi:hypothetical protein
MAKRLVAVFALAAMIFSLTAIGFAQESTVKGNIGGTVSDPSGAVIAGANVTVVGPTGERTAVTDAEGRFLVQLLIPGYYNVKVSKEGFKTAEVKTAEVVTGRTSNVTVKLELGTSATTIEVSASSVNVDTTSTAAGSNLTDNFYQSVPVGRGVTGLFYAAPGVTSGGGTGTANPSIAGGTGLENNYVADGVSITDAGFGGIGVYSRNYGSLSTGINLSFVKEVDVKTGGFEAQYGKSTGGIVQIVTKSGSNQFHGSVGGFFAPQKLEGTRLQADDFAAGTQNTLFNRTGKILHQSNYDVNAEIGGPLIKDRIFFFGSFNPQWNTDHDRFADFLNVSDTLNGTPTQGSLGNRDISSRVYSYAGKGTLKLSDHHQFEVSIFGDPSYGDFDPHGNAGLITASPSTFDKLQYGTRNFVARYNGTLSPTGCSTHHLPGGTTTSTTHRLQPRPRSTQSRTRRNGILASLPQDRHSLMRPVSLPNNRSVASISDKDWVITRTQQAIRTERTSIPRRRSASSASTTSTSVIVTRNRDTMATRTTRACVFRSTLQQQRPPAHHRRQLRMR